MRSTSLLDVVSRNTKVEGLEPADRSLASNVNTIISRSSNPRAPNRASNTSKSPRVTSLLEETYPSSPLAPTTKAMSSSTLFTGKPKCSGSDQPPAALRVVLNTSNPPMPCKPFDAKKMDWPSAATKGVTSSPQVFTREPRDASLVHSPSSFLALSYKSNPPSPRLLFRLTTRRLPSGKKAIWPWLGMCLSKKNGSACDQPLAPSSEAFNSEVHPSSSVRIILVPNASTFTA